MYIVFHVSRCILFFNKNSLTSNLVRRFLDVAFCFFFVEHLLGFLGTMISYLVGGLRLIFSSGVMQHHLNWGAACYGEQNYHLCICIYMQNNNCHDCQKIWPLFLPSMICFLSQISRVLDQSTSRQHDNVPLHFDVFPWLVLLDVSPWLHFHVSPCFYYIFQLYFFFLDWKSWLLLYLI